ITEVVAVLLISLAVFFWLSLLIDYGASLIGVDWVRDLPRWFRALLLGGGLLAVCFVVEIRKSLRTRRILAEHRALTSTGVAFTSPRRGLLVLAVSAPILLVYFACWVGVALWRDSGDITSLATG